MAQRIRCKHQNTEDTLVIGTFKKIENDILLKDAILITSCKDCNVELENNYVCGGVVFNAKNASAQSTTGT